MLSYSPPTPKPSFCAFFCNQQRPSYQSATDLLCLCSLSPASLLFYRQSIIFYLTNRFHVAVRLFSNRSQMTSKCGKNKKVAHEAQLSVSLMFLPHFDVFCDPLLNETHGNMESICLYNNEKPFLFQNIST